LGQAIGRWGNYFNQELYGWPTNLPWGIDIRLENRLPGFEQFTKFHPLFLYESLWCLVIFTLLLMLSTHYSLIIAKKTTGTIFFLYLFLYSFGRFWLEFLRIDSWLIAGMRVNQLVALGLMLLSGAYFIYNWSLQKRSK
jgi:phosphatidylglycerol:prolipoprotein diacylglycerol transferase